MALYEKTVELSKKYLGPAGQQFLDRQIKSHLSMEPQQIAAGNLAELSKWCFISGKLIIDEKQAAEFSEKIKTLN
jgi:hypothetical protein